MKETKQLLERKELAEYYQVHLSTVDRWKSIGCPSIQVVKGLRHVTLYDLNEVKKWMDEKNERKV